MIQISVNKDNKWKPH